MGEWPESEFVTISEAARRLGISERQVRRWAGRLPEGDRLASGPMTGPGPAPSPARVRLSALVELRKQSIHGFDGRNGDRPEPDADGVGAGRDDRSLAGHASGPTPDASPLMDMVLAEKDRRIEELAAALEHERTQHQADVERWSKAHDQGQQLHLATVGEMQRWQQRASELESANQKLIAAMEAPADPAPNTATSAPGSVETSTGDQTRVETPEAVSEGNSEGLPERRRSFLDWLMRRKA